MFIKITGCTDNQDIIVNTENITFIKPFVKADGTQGCYMNFTSGDMLSVKQNIPTLECLIEVNSIKKKIDNLKNEDTLIKLQEIYDETFKNFME